MELLPWCQISADSYILQYLIGFWVTWYNKSL